MFGEKIIGGDKGILTNSREIAERFSKDHDKVCKAIENTVKKNPEITDDFILSYYISSRGRKYKYYLLTKNAVDILINKFKYNVRFARFEYKYLNEIEDFLNMMNIGYLEQYQVGNYRIDLYIPKFNLAIEIDEKEHKYKQNYDKIRQKYIKDKIHCKFIRINEGESCGSIIARITKELYKCA